MTDISIARAREHIAEGERYLAEARSIDTASTAFDAAQWCAARAAIATAHFGAAMAITNVLLTDPAEMPEPVEL